MTYRVQDLPSDQRPRERLLSRGPGSLSDVEIMAVLLGTGTMGQSVLQVSQELLEDGWKGLKNRTAEELLKVRGLGKAKVALLLAALEIGSRLAKQEVGGVIEGPEDAVLLLSDMTGLDQEEFRVILLNTKGRVLAINTVFRGGLDSVEVFPREIFKRAVAHSAASIIVAHNHPSGDPTPSPEDRKLTRRLEEAGTIMGITVLDHIVIGHSQHVSLHQGQTTKLS
ncbi:MAG: JAB domain-containing protein [Sulfobacillus benefaciens]|uniref:JAB domain-containing protein n=1 Tax=Sulfobacillus benefaciens TaxID=453960 RepID=A0A2T2XJ48_9FIRM|nr:MAG: JAB domain-containing protein [Sulfobacillus benefaciens]